MTHTATEGGMMGAEFTVIVENVSSAETLQTMDDPKPVPLAAFPSGLHEDPGPLFTAGEPAIAGLGDLAEDRSPPKLTEELEMADFHARAQAVPVGAEGPGPIGPGGAYEFTIEVHEGQAPSLATMFVQSNDRFSAPAPAGIPLWTDSERVDGGRTGKLTLWDAGTEENQEPGTGSDQAPRQESAATGASQDGVARRISSEDDGSDYPAADDVIQLTITPDGMDGQTADMLNPFKP